MMPNMLLRPKAAAGGRRGSVGAGWTPPAPKWPMPPTGGPAFETQVVDQSNPPAVSKAHLRVPAVAKRPPPVLVWPPNPDRMLREELQWRMADLTGGQGSARAGQPPEANFQGLQMDDMEEGNSDPVFGSSNGSFGSIDWYAVEEDGWGQEHEPWEPQDMMGDPWVWEVSNEISQEIERVEQERIEPNSGMGGTRGDHQGRPPWWRAAELSRIRAPLYETEDQWSGAVEGETADAPRGWVQRPPKPDHNQKWKSLTWKKRSLEQQILDQKKRLERDLSDSTDDEGNMGANEEQGLENQGGKKRCSPQEQGRKLDGKFRSDLDVVMIESSPETAHEEDRMSKAVRDQFPKRPDKEQKGIAECLEDAPDAVKVAVRNSPVSDHLPKELFCCSLKEGTYDGMMHQLIKILRKGDSKLVSELVKWDCMRLREVRDIKASRAKSYFYNKFGLANREVLKILGLPTMSVAIDKVLHDRSEVPEWGRRWEIEADNWVMTSKAGGLENPSTLAQGGGGPEEEKIRRGTKRRLEEMMESSRKSAHNEQGNGANQQQSMKGCGLDSSSDVNARVDHSTDLAAMKESDTSTENVEDRLHQKRKEMRLENKTRTGGKYDGMPGSSLTLDQVEIERRNAARTPVDEESTGNQPKADEQDTQEGQTKPGFGNVEMPSKGRVRTRDNVEDSEQDTDPKWTPAGKLLKTMTLKGHMEEVKKRQKRISNVAKPLRGSASKDIGGWECEDGVLVRRSGAFPTQLKGMEITASQDWEVADSSQQDTPSQIDAPISVLQKMDTTEDEKPLELLFKDRINDLTVAEKACMNQMKVGKGHSQRADYVAPNSVYIMRCPIRGCHAPVNTYGLARAIRTHLSTRHPEIKTAVEATVLKFRQPHPVTYLCPAPRVRGPGGRGGWMPASRQTEGDTRGQDEAQGQQGEGKADGKEGPLSEECEEEWSTVGFPGSEPADVLSDGMEGEVPEEDDELELSLDPSQEPQWKSGGVMEVGESDNPEDPSGTVEDRQVNEYHLAILGGACAAGVSNRKKEAPNRKGEEESGSDADDAPGKDVFTH